MPYFASMPTSPSPLLATGGSHHAVGRGSCDAVRLQLDVPAGRRQLETDQRGGGRDTEEPLRSAHHRGQRREVHPLVLATDGAAHLDAPRLIDSRDVAHRLEGNRHLDRPATFEAARAHFPHGIPVGVRIPFVGLTEVDAAAHRVRVEDVPVAAVVKGVDHEPEVVVLPHLVRVATHLVRHPLVGRRRFPAAGRHVEVLGVEHHPGFRPLGGLGAVPRQRLDEVGDWRSCCCRLPRRASRRCAAARSA